MAEESIPVGVTPAEAIAWFRAKGYQFGFSWQDVEREEHGRGFTVAKAMTRDVLETLRTAVDRAIAEGETLQMFAKELRPRLEAAGWWGRKEMVDPATGETELVQLGSPRRLKTIFEVNMRTSYAAGRWERIQRNKRAFPFLEYVTADDIRVRPQHAAWHGTVLPVDDPWWDTHYPPNGWGCRCLPKPVSRGQAERRGLKPTMPKAFPTRQWINRRTGEIQTIERGIDPGWDYHVGKARHSGLTPGPYRGDGLAVMSALSGPDEDAVSGFFAAFGLTTRAAIVAGEMFVDAGGWPIAIDGGWFRDGRDRLALPAGLAAADLDEVAAAILSPSEIRWHWVATADTPAQLVRRYIGMPATDGSAIVVDIARWWRAARLPAARLDRARRGDLAWAAEIAVAAYDPSQPRHPKGSRDGGRFRSSGRGALLASLAGDRTFFRKKVVGQVSADAADRARAAGFDIAGKGVAIEHTMAIHILDTHGAGRESRRDQVAIAARDILAAPRHLNAATEFLPARTHRGGTPRIEVRDGATRMLFENGRRNLTLVSMYRKK